MQCQNFRRQILQCFFRSVNSPVDNRFCCVRHPIYTVHLAHLFAVRDCLKSRQNAPFTSDDASHGMVISSEICNMIILKAYTPHLLFVQINTDKHKTGRALVTQSCSPRLHKSWKLSLIVPFGFCWLNCRKSGQQDVWVFTLASRKMLLAATFTDIKL